jgi:SAM-dependent methyltransferase
VQDPSILTSFQRSQRAAFASMWKWMATPIDERYARYKEPFLAEVSGVVLDLGSGQGQNLRYLSPKKIKHLYLVEPNPGMHANLRLNAIKAGFAGDQFTIIATGAENAAEVQRLTGLGKESVDTVTSLLALCGIPQPRWIPHTDRPLSRRLAHDFRLSHSRRTVIAALYDYLKPGGKFYFFEHVASKHTPARRTQGGCWRSRRRHPVNQLTSSTRVCADRINPLWSFLFGGCQVNRSTDKWILDSFEWSDKKGSCSAALSVRMRTGQLTWHPPTLQRCLSTLRLQLHWIRKRMDGLRSPSPGDAPKRGRRR